MATGMSNKMFLAFCLLVPVAIGIAREDRALLEVVLYERNEHGEIETVKHTLGGQFSSAGATASAEGTIVQVNI